MKILSLLLLFYFSNVQAYILPAAKILEQMSKNNLADQKFQDVSLKKGNDHSLVKLELNRRGLFINDEQSADKNASTKNENVDIFILQSLLAQKPESLKKYLSDLGIDLATVSLALVDSEPFFIIGAKLGEEKPQLWVHKNTFLPAKEMSKSRVTSFKWTDKDFPSLITTTDAGLTTSISLSSKETP